jgi:hypothetical protein
MWGDSKAQTVGVRGVSTGRTRSAMVIRDEGQHRTWKEDAHRSRCLVAQRSRIDCYCWPVRALPEIVCDRRGCVCLQDSTQCLSGSMVLHLFVLTRAEKGREGDQHV